MISSEYISSYGFIMGDSKQPGMNDWLITGVAVALNLYDPKPEVAKALFIECRKSAFCPLIYRGPLKKNSDDTEKIDDYWGAMLIASRYYPTFAEDTLRWAESHQWNLNVQDPESKDPEYRFDRFPAFPPLLRLAAGRGITATDHATLLAALAVDCADILKGDGNMRAICRLALAKRSSALYYPAYEVWEAEIKKKYHGRIALSFQGACDIGNDHPIVKSGV